MIEEINGEKSEEEDEDKEDKFSFHGLFHIRLTLLKGFGEHRAHVKTSILLTGREGWVSQPE